MIQRIVLVKLDEVHSTTAKRSAVAERSRQVLGALPGVEKVDVGVPADPSATADWDLSLVLHFASRDDLEPYRVHPEHRAYVDEYLKPKLECIKAWNFEITK